MTRYWRKRTLCDVLGEMRDCTKTHNYSYLPGLIEEAQSMGNRMEAGLSEVKDLQSMQDEWSVKRKELKKVEETLAKLNNQVKQLSQLKKELRDETAKEKGKLRTLKGESQSEEVKAVPCGGACSRGCDAEEGGGEEA